MTQLAANAAEPGTPAALAETRLDLRRPLRSGVESTRRPRALCEGTVLGQKYRLLRIIGQGGMATVYEASHLHIGRRFAIKVLNADLVDNQEMLARFRLEALAAGSIEHENVVAVLDLGETEQGLPFLVMEYLAGEDLRQLLGREGPLPLARAARIAIDACRGLAAAHAAGIVHRDIKPENLFVCRHADGSDWIKLLDFGVAKLALSKAPPLRAEVTRIGSVVGTLHYMAPEQALGCDDVDHRADIYGLGVILYEAVSGAKPHSGSSYEVVLHNILVHELRALESLRPSLPRSFCRLVQRVLAADPAHRPQTANELARWLAPYAEHGAFDP